tara:strand:- start:234 stop:437 length:204 start_codon:yes stop_codon:yes gene_type:complete
MARQAWTAVITRQGFSIGLAEEGTKGYSPTEFRFATYEKAQAHADKLNKGTGLSTEEAFNIVADTMA